jgi:hypothetical protein
VNTDKPRFDERFGLEEKIISDVVTYGRSAVAAVVDLLEPDASPIASTAASTSRRGGCIAAAGRRIARRSSRS